MEIEHIKNQGVTFWPERIGPLFPMLWTGHEFGHRRQPYAPNVFENVFIMLSFASELALSPNPLLYLVFLSKFVVAARAVAKFRILYH
jgi:hypothetical protein